MHIKSNIVIIFLVCGVTFFSCTKENSINSNDERMVLMNSSFEINDTPSRDNWNGRDSVTNLFLSFSKDVPQNAGKWSLLFKVDTVQSHTIDYHLPINNTYSNDLFILSYWLKKVGNIQVKINLEFVSTHYDLLSLKLFRGNDSTWVYYIDTLKGINNDVSKIDSSHFNITVENYNTDLSLPYRYDSSYCLFDNIKVERLRK